MPSKKADPFHWDALVRLTHWGVAAICIGNLWLNEAGEEWHERMGYAVMVLIGIRLLWGLTFARGHARLRALIPSREDFRHQADALRERTPPTPGHHGSGKLAVWALWLLVLATAGTGWFQNTETGFDLGADDWHEWCTWALQGMIALHLCAIAYTSWRQRSNLVTRMLPGRRARASAGQQEPNAGPVPGSRNPTSERSRGPAGPLFIPFATRLTDLAPICSPLHPPAATEWHESIFIHIS